MNPSKDEVLARVRARIQEQLDSIVGAARAAHDAATNEESKAENKYDTRALEASYLAGAQARRAGELEEMRSRYQRLAVREFADGDAVALTALVELESEEDGARSWYFLGPCGGGIKIESRGHAVTVITPAAPLGRALLDRAVGDEVSVKGRGGMRVYEIARVL